jgi:hypothetical protein
MPDDARPLKANEARQYVAALLAARGAEMPAFQAGFPRRKRREQRSGARPAQDWAVGAIGMETARNPERGAERSARKRVCSGTPSLPRSILLRCTRFTSRVGAERSAHRGH